MTNFKIIARQLQEITVYPGDNIQLAINKIGPGGAIFLSNGTYLMGEDIVLPKNARIVGLGNNIIEGNSFNNHGLEIQGNNCIVINNIF